MIAEISYCNRCKQDKPLSEFHRTRNKPAHYCKVCVSEWGKQRRMRHRLKNHDSRTVLPATVRCPTCQVAKSRDQFYNSVATKTGLSTYCKKCHSARAKNTYRRRAQKEANQRKVVKLHLISRAGGKCVRCGYHEFMAALDFHHVEGKKEASIAALITNARYGNKDAMARLFREVEKTILLCGNCHHSLHAGDWQISDL